MKVERRILFTKEPRFAVARAEGKPVTLAGYALVWNILSSDRGGYMVRLLPGSAKFAKPTIALYHHDFHDVLGTTENGSLRLTSDDVGVRFEIDLPATRTAQDVAALVDGKYVQGMSFAMTDTPDGVRKKEGDQEILEASSFTIDEITVTPIPAFPKTSVNLKTDAPAARAAARIQQSLQLQRYRADLYRLPRAETSRAV